MPELCKQWQAWWSEFSNIVTVKVPRWYGTLRTCKVVLHVFVDASQLAFAAVSYFRIEDHRGTSVMFVAGRTRTAPKKLLSISKLELQAAILGLRLAKLIRKSHECKVA